MKVLNDWKSLLFYAIKGTQNSSENNWKQVKQSAYISLLPGHYDNLKAGESFVLAGFCCASLNENDISTPICCEIEWNPSYPNVGSFFLVPNEQLVLLPPFLTFKVLEITSGITKGNTKLERYMKVKCLGMESLKDLALSEVVEQIKELECVLSSLSNTLDDFEDRNLVNQILSPIVGSLQKLQEQQQKTILQVW